MSPTPGPDGPGPSRDRPDAAPPPEQEPGRGAPVPDAPAPDALVPDAQARHVGEELHEVRRAVSHDVPDAAHDGGEVSRAGRAAVSDTASALADPGVSLDGAAGDLHDPEDEPLACGRLLGDLWEAWEHAEGDLAGDGADPHLAAGCPHCAQALAGMRVLDDFARQARASDADERPRTSAGLPSHDSVAHDSVADDFSSRVMDLVRMELRPGRPVPLGEPSEDHWIGETAATKTFREAAEALPGVRAGSCRITPMDAAVPGPRRARPRRALPRGPVRVRLEVVAPLHWTVPDLAADVRERVAEAADRTLGMTVGAIDIRVTDLLVGQDDGRSSASERWSER